MHTLSAQDRIINAARLVTELGWGGEAGIRGKLITIYGAPCNYNLMVAVAREAYGLGAKHCAPVIIAPEVTALHLQAHAEDAELRNFVDPLWADYWNGLVDDSGCTVRITPAEDPLALSECDGGHVGERAVAEHKARSHFYDDGLFAGTLPWTILPQATPGWAKMLDLEVDDLQEALDQILMTDRPDCVERWRALTELSSRRGEALNALKPVAVHFEGPGTDLTVGLMPLSRFSAALKTTAGGVTFMANIPTFENFSTPDARLTRGYFACTRPVIIDGTLVDGLKVWFNDEGEVDRFEASQGREAFEAVLAAPGGNRLGEVALVGLDGNSIFSSGLVFKNTLLDENAACHVAFGRGYPMQIEGGTEMDESQLNEIGCNYSEKHHDVMLSDLSTQVHVILGDGSRVQVIKDGKWCENLLS